MTTMLKKTSGTFSGTGASSKVHGKKVSGFIDMGSGTTVTLRSYDPATGTALVAETYTADAPIYAELPHAVDWDLNCSVYSASTVYSLQATDQGPA